MFSFFLSLLKAEYCTAFSFMSLTSSTRKVSINKMTITFQLAMDVFSSVGARWTMDFVDLYGSKNVGIFV
jgi:hypothetical protein